MALASATAALHGSLAFGRVDAERRAMIAALGGVLLVAFALRLIPVLLVPSLNWADEVFQATEQAHRLVYGNGLVPWEFRLGARSWLLPGALAGVMEFSRLFGDGPEYYLPVIAGACSLLALAPVACCFLWCRRWFGLGPAVVGGLAVAVAPELIYFGPRTLSEAISGHLLVLGIYLLAPGFRVESQKRLFTAGGILALTCMIRIQLAPAVAVIALWALWRAPLRHVRAFASAGLLVLAVVAVLDTATEGYPFASLWRYVLLNIYYDVSSSFGTKPWYWYGLTEWAVWGAGLWVLLILVVFGSRRNILPLAAATIIVATHSLIAHKEYRFIYPALVLLAVQVGLGLADLAFRLQQCFGDYRVAFARAAIPATVALTWCLLAFSIWSTPTLAGLRHTSQHHLAAALFVARARGVCGIGLYDPNGRAWARYGGYTYLHQSVPIFWSSTQAGLAALARRADVLLYVHVGGSGNRLPTGFARKRCFGKVCVARRAAGCESRSMAPLPFPSPLSHARSRG